MRETPNMAANSTRPPMALMVISVNRTAGRRQVRTDVFITTTVFRNTVYENYDALRPFWNPGSVEQEMTGRPSMMRFSSADSGLFQTGCALREKGWARQRGQDSDALRIAARASLTR